MSKVFEITSVEWQPVRPEITTGIWGRTMLDEGIKAVLTRVEPGGKFRVHRDNYSHLFYFVSGEGKVWVGGQRFDARAGLVVQVPAREDHAYENTGSEDLILISLNMPTK